jgi:hypothetical protein
MSASAAPTRPPLDATEAIRLPAVPAEHLDQVLRAAGSSLYPALAVLVAAIGFLIARCFHSGARAVLLRGIPGAIALAVRLHDGVEGRG